APARSEILLVIGRRSAPGGGAPAQGGGQADTPSAHAASRRRAEAGPEGPLPTRQQTHPHRQGASPHEATVGGGERDRARHHPLASRTHARGHKGDPCNDEIARIVTTDTSTWTSDGVCSETLVHLIRVLCDRGGEEGLLGRLVDQLGRHIAQIAKDVAKGFDPTTTDEIVVKVGQDVVALVSPKARPDRANSSKSPSGWP